MKAEEAYALSRKYTEDTIEGAGAVAGKPCQIQSITDITGGHRVTFLWLDNEGASHTSAMDVMDGAKGDKGDSGDAGLGIKSVAVNTEDHLIITYDDDTTQDAGQIQVMAAVDSVNGKTGDVVLGASDVGALPDDTDIPSKTSDLTNDSIVDSASYDSANHQILFKNGTTTLFSLDATAFVKDGMVDDVEISGGNLVITFNTDAGKQAISIPLTDIFDPANYYDKDDVDGLLGDKADKVASATNGNFAGLDANGNLTDSGKKASDFGTADEISDIVNVYGAKNLMETTASSHTQNGITKTVNADGSFTLNGTATDNTYFYWTRQTEFPTENIQYTYSIETSAVWGIGKAIAGIDKRSETAYIDRYKSLFADGTTHIEGTFTGESGYYAWAWIFIPNGTQLTDVIVKGMIRLASVKDNTYVPYAPTNAKLNEEKMSYADNGVLGAKNLLKNNATSQTISGVTFTVNADGSVTANGTATANITSYFIDRVFSLKAGKYLISGTPNSIFGISGNGVRISNDDFSINVYGDEDGTLFTLNNDTSGLKVEIRIASGTTVSNLTFYPMIRLASDPDDTYQPYAMTNKELTEEVNALPRKVFVTTDTRTTTTNDANTLPCGFTRMSDANSNLPTDGTGGNVWYDILTVRQSNDSSKETWGYGFQLAVQTTTNANMGDMYVRAVNGGATPTWGAWRKLN